MICVTVYQKEKGCVGFLARGHAGFGEKGQDIVCAAVSVLLESTVNGIEAFAGQRLQVRCQEAEGLLEARCVEKPNEKTGLLLDSMLLTLTQLSSQKEYQDCIKMTYKEV